MITTDVEKGWEWEGGREGGKEQKNLWNEGNCQLEDVFLEKEKVYGKVVHCNFCF